MSQELEVVLAAVREAAQLLVEEAARPEGPRGAGTKAPVDAEIGALLCARIHAAFPEDHIICEEGGGHIGTRMRAFHIDPHDGTRDFLDGHRETSISVALVDDGQLMLGVVYAPMRVPLFGDQPLLVSWAKGEPLSLNGAPIAPSTMDTALAATQTILVSTRIQGELWDANAQHLAPARPAHCASIATRLALAAIGTVDAGFTINHQIQSWDFAAGQALLQAAGGDLFDPMGQPIKWVGIHHQAPTLPGFFGARSAQYAGLIADCIRPMVKLS